jgi:HAD superfamily hydrolase (TIGR01484 family)
MKLRPLDEMPDEACRSIRTLFTDIDDTITTGGRIPPEAYSAVCAAREAGIAVVLVTGRPGGWCDHLARMWPVAAVVGENGALAFACEGGRMRRVYAPREPGAAEKLAEIRDEVLREVPGCRVAADQPYREYDLAIDFREEVPPLPDEAVGRIVDVFRRHGATAKVSSIHVNGWFGDFDKLSMCRRASEEFLGGALDTGRSVYLGDSPNDVPMFRAFPCSIGVANVREWVHRMEALPAFVTPSAGGRGFAEAVAHLLRVRGSPPGPRTPPPRTGQPKRPSRPRRSS